MNRNRREETKKMMNVIFKVYPVVPLILFVVTVLLLVSALKKNNTYVSTNGTIISFREETSVAKLSDHANKIISPVVAYSVNGNNYRFVGNYFSNTMKIGETVEVMYEENNPNNATLKMGMYVAPIITGGLTLLFLLGYIVLGVLKLKEIF